MTALTQKQLSEVAPLLMEVDDGLEKINVALRKLLKHDILNREDVAQVYSIIRRLEHAQEAFKLDIAVKPKK